MPSQNYGSEKFVGIEMGLRKFLSELDREGEVLRIGREVSTNYEVARELDRLDGGPAVVFEKVEHHDMKIVGNLCGSRKRIALGLGVKSDQILHRIREATSNPRRPKKASEAPVQEVVQEIVDLRNLPVLKHFERDGGPYVTSSIFVAEDNEGNRNLSFHRLQLIDRERFAIRLVPRDLHRMFMSAEEMGEPLEVAAVLGTHPATALAAATSLSYDVDEYGIAGSLHEGLKLVDCETVDLSVPARAEIVLEGKLLPGERASEGPFADITGSYDRAREQPVFEVKCLTRRKDAFYQAILPGSTEHQLLMGMPREPLIFGEVEKVARPREVFLTPGGCGWLHAVISISKQKENDGKRAIDAAFEAHPSLKHVVIVDDDIDVHDAKQVEWAIATRSRADMDAVVKSKVRGSSLDPTADPETELGGKMGIDATRDLDKPKKFERAKIPRKGR